MAAWLKTFRKGNPLSPRKSPDQRPPIGGSWTFYEPLSVKPDGSAKLTRQGEPMGRPSYEVGDLIVGYWSGSYEVGEVWEVTGEPERSELDDWSWQTPVALLDDQTTVSLSDLAIRPETVARRVRLRLRPHQEERLERAFGVEVV